MPPRERGIVLSRPLDSFTPNLTVLGKPREPLLTLDLFVVTPLFGGGVTAREVDQDRPVAGKAVRGHLRFWWRACRGVQYTTVRELFAAEAAIWGSTERPAAVGVDVEIIDKGQVRDFNTWRSDPAMPHYGLFPFFPQPARNGQPGKPAAACIEGVHFRLRLMGPEAHRAEVEAAVWAWIMFGGVGARTRRGCGTLFCEHDGFRSTRETLSAQAHSHILQGERVLAVPMLSGGRILVAKELAWQETAKQSWTTAVVAMQEFRQGVNFARNPGLLPSRPGRSRWPEPDSIRDLANMAAGRRLTTVHSPAHPARPFFPRADLGLPIVFHFINEPYGETLQPIAHKLSQSRMSSPVILKALPLSTRAAVPMAILLNAPHIWDKAAPNLGFRGGASLPKSCYDQSISATRIANVPPMGGQLVREAFWDFAKGKLATTKGKWDGLEVTLP